MEKHDKVYIAFEHFIYLYNFTILLLFFSVSAAYLILTNIQNSSIVTYNFNFIQYFRIVIFTIIYR